MKGFPQPAPLVFTPSKIEAEEEANSVENIEIAKVEKVIEVAESVENIEVEKVLMTVENVEVEQVVETAKDPPAIVSPVSEEKESDEEQESVEEKENVEENEKKEKISLEERLRIQERIRLLEEALRWRELEKEKNKSPECRNCGEAFAADHQC